MLQRDLAVSRDEVESLRKELADTIESNQAFEEQIVELNQKV